jgi:hypothetical protein
MGYRLAPRCTGLCRTVASHFRLIFPSALHTNMGGYDGQD